MKKFGKMVLLSVEAILFKFTDSAFFPPIQNVCQFTCTQSKECHIIATFTGHSRTVGAQSLEVYLTFLENLWTPTLSSSHVVKNMEVDRF
jgi:hypothetical protein